MKLIQVYEIHEVVGKGISLGGTNPNLDHLTDKDFEEYIGRGVRIKLPEGTIVRSKILDLDSSSSIVDKKNIFILVERNDATLAISTNSEVWLDSEEDT